jgi:hypothetical protein
VGPVSPCVPGNGNIFKTVCVSGEFDTIFIFGVDAATIFTVGLFIVTILTFGLVEP